MELLNTSTTILVIQVLFLPIQIWLYLIRYRDKTRMRFLVLNVGFILFSLTLAIYQLTGSTTWNTPKLIVYFGIGLFVYLYYYVSSELNVYSLKHLIKILLGCIILQLFSDHFQLQKLDEKDEFIGRLLVASVLEIILIWSSIILLVRRTLEPQLKSIPFVICARIVLLLVLTLPFTTVLVSNFKFQTVYINLPFFILSFGYYWQLIELNKKENESTNPSIVEAQNLIELKQLMDVENISSYELKGALLEIAELLAEGYTQDEIAVKRNVTAASVRNQCSKIYKKVGVKNLSSFREKFKTKPRQ